MITPITQQNAAGVICRRRQLTRPRRSSSRDYHQRAAVGVDQPVLGPAAAPPPQVMPAEPLELAADLRVLGQRLQRADVGIPHRPHFQLTAHAPHGATTLRLLKVGRPWKGSMIRAVGVSSGWQARARTC
jgi:hypothetical protein